MPLFRWRFGSRGSGAPTAAMHGTDDNGNPPPSYEESQDASLRVVLQGAMAVAPILWPSAIKRIPSPSDECWRLDTDENDNEKQNQKHAFSSRSAEEDTIVELLTNLAMTPCGDHHFLDRIREFSDFYFAPYIASEGAAIQSSSLQRDNSDASSSLIQEVPVQEHHQKILHNLEVPRESSALVLCARALENYYAGLGHVDSTVDMDVTREISTPYQKFPDEKTTSNEPSPTPTGQTKTKASLTQIAACVEEDCTCCDYDEATPTRPNSPSPSLPQVCGCGHPRTSHTASPLGISRLLRRYTNWDCATYQALKHRSSTGQKKRQIRDIQVCGVPGGCPCRDFDKGRRTGRCARCGHYCKDHLPINAAREPAKKHGKKKDKGKEKEKDGANGMKVNDPKKTEWELSWILVENAYLLLNHITPIS